MRDQFEHRYPRYDRIGDGWLLRRPETPEMRMRLLPARRFPKAVCAENATIRWNANGKGYAVGKG